MFGNALGWLISLVIVVTAACFLYVLHGQGGVSPPGPVGANAMNWTAQLPVEPAGLAPYMLDPVDPYPLYQQALSLYEADRYELERESIVSTRSPGAVRWGRIMDLLVQAGNTSRPVVFGANPSDLINYDPDRPKLEALRSIGNTAVRLGLLHLLEGDKDAAKRYGQAVFALGAKLYSERLTFGQYMLAHGLLGDSAQLLAKVAEAQGQADRAAALLEFDRRRVEAFRKQIEPVQRALLVLEPNPGDVLALADNATEAMWRVEAVLALGRLRYSAQRFGDKRGAVKLAESLCGSGDPRVRTAAMAARDLTVEQFRKLR